MFKQWFGRHGRYDDTLESALRPAPAGVDAGPGAEHPDYAVARFVADGLAPLRTVPPAEVSARVWREAGLRIAVAEGRPLWQRAGGAFLDGLTPAGRRALSGVAAAVVFAGLVATPLGHEKLVEAWDSVQIMMMPVIEVTKNPDGSYSYKMGPPKAVKVIPIGDAGSGNTMLIAADDLLPLAEAERQAGFKAQLPTNLPAGVQLIGARVGTTSEGRKQISLLYLNGGRLTTFSQAPNSPPLTPPADATPIQVGQAAGWTSNPNVQLGNATAIRALPDRIALTAALPNPPGVNGTPGGQSSPSVPAPTDVAVPSTTVTTAAVTRPFTVAPVPAVGPAGVSPIPAVGQTGAVTITAAAQAGALSVTAPAAPTFTVSSAPVASLFGHRVIWQVGSTTFQLTGPQSPEELARIGASVR